MFKIEHPESEASKNLFLSHNSGSMIIIPIEILLFLHKF